MADITYLNKDKNATDGRQIFTDQDANMVKAAVNSKVDKEVGKGLSSNDFTNTFKAILETIHTTFFALTGIKQTTGQGEQEVMSQKAVSDELASLQTQLNSLPPIPPDRFKGLHTTLAALQAAYPNGTVGDFADIDPGTGTNAQRYLWDVQEGWVPSSAPAGTTLPPNGTAAHYLRGDQTWQPFGSTVLSTALTTVTGGTNTALIVGLSIQQSLLNLQAQVAANSRETVATSITVAVANNNYRLAQRPGRNHCHTDLVVGGRNSQLLLGFTMAEGDSHMFNVVNQHPSLTVSSFPLTFEGGLRYGGSTTQQTTIGVGEVWEFLAMCKSGGRIVISTLGKEKLSTAATFTP